MTPDECPICDSPIGHDGSHETPDGKNCFESEEHATRAHLGLREDLAFTRGRLAKTENALVRAERERDEAQRRSEEHTSELQSRGHLVCRLLLEKKKKVD